MKYKIVIGGCEIAHEDEEHYHVWKLVGCWAGVILVSWALVGLVLYGILWVLQ